MALAIPKASAYTVKQGATGAAAFAVQRACNKFGYPTAEDGNFGDNTFEVVKKLQARLNVPADGVFGPQSSKALAVYLGAREENINDTPHNLLWSQISYESGGLIAAVNWGTPGGVDCGMTQRRVYSDDYSNDAVIKRAFDAHYQMSLLADSLRNLYDTFLARPGVKRNGELAWRLAVLNHNYPLAADLISRYGFAGLSSSWNQTASWVSHWGLRFPDGEQINTPLEWAQRYALGNKAHNEPGQAVKLVKTWA